jgi:hypothetical protein
MYTEYLKIGPSKFGFGVFTMVDIPGNVPIMECTGDILSGDAVPHDDPALLQIGHDLYLGSSGDASDYINHHCNPNCYLHIVGVRAILFSLHHIKAGSELFFDYSTTSTDTLEQWQMECKCGAFNCRKIISGFHYLDESIKEGYKNRGLVPMFITNNIIMKKC